MNSQKCVQWQTFLLLTLPSLFPYHSYPLTTFEAEWFTFVLAVTFTSSVFFFNFKSISVPRFSLPMFAFAGYIALSAAFLPYWQRPVMASGYVLMATMTAVASSQVRYSVRSMLLPALATGGFLVAIGGYFEYFQLGWLVSEKTIGGGMVGTLGQRNMFSAYVACGLLALLSIRLHWVTVLLAGVPMAIAEAYSGARVAWIFWLIIVSITLFRSRQNVWLVPALLGVFIGFKLTVAEHVVSRLTFDILAPAITSGDGLWERVEYAKMAFRMWFEHPIFGVGFGEMGWHAFLQADHPNSVIERHSHNVVLQVLAEFGLVGFLLLSMVADRLFKNLKWLIRQSRLFPTLYSSGDVWPVFGLMAIIITFSFTEFPLWHAQMLILFTILISLLPGASCIEPIRVNLLTWAIGTMTAFLSLIWIMTDYVKYKEFYTGQSSSVEFKSFFRPNLEFMVGQLMTSKPGTLEKEAKFYEKVLHVYPKESILCRYIIVLNQLGRESQHALDHTKNLYGSGACNDRH